MDSWSNQSKKMSLRIVLLALLATQLALHRLTTAEEDGEGSGSGNDQEDCLEPNPLPEALGDSQQVAGDMQPRCHLACIENITKQEGIDMETLIDRTYPAWPMIPNTALEMNCSLNKQVEACRDGCARFNYNQCLNKCNKQRVCNNSSEQNHTCEICTRKYCFIGCDMMLHLRALQNMPSAEKSLPLPPTASMDLYPTDGIEDQQYVSDAGLYTIDPRLAVPIISSNDTEIFPAIMVARVSKSINRRKFMWMASFEEVFNLTAYACQEVTMQWGVVNIFGEAPQSFGLGSSRKIVVYGESEPTHTEHPRFVIINVKNDTRQGFWKHAIVTIYWKKPLRGFGLFAFYNVTFQLDNFRNQPFCKPEFLNITVYEKRGEDLRWIIQAENVGDGPVSDCHYLVQVESVSTNESTGMSNVTTYPVHINSSHTVPVPLNPVWNRTWNERTGNYTYSLDWSMPNDTNVQRAVRSFEVVVFLVAPDNTETRVTSSHFSANNSSNNNMGYHYSQEVKHDEKNYHHLIKLKSWLGDESKAVFVPAPLSKSYLAEAPPPDQVEGVMAEVDGTENSDPYITLSIKVEWEKVESDIAYYLLRVVWDNTTGPASSIYHHQLTENNAHIEELKFKPDPHKPCVYIQVKAVTLFNAEGNWSEPLCLEVPSLPNTPNTIDTPTVLSAQTADTKSKPDEGETVVFIVVAVVVLLLICIVVLAIFIFAFLYPRNRKQKRVRRANTVFMTRNTSEKDKYTVGKLDQWEIYSNQMVIQSRLGEGAFGEVYRGLFDSTMTEKSSVKKFDTNNSVVVAVKLLRDDATDRDRQIFLKHILQAKKVAQNNHPNLVCLVGCVTEMEPLSLLTEYPEQGDLLTYLRSQRMEIYQSKLQMMDYQNGASAHKLSNIMPQYNSEQSLHAQDLMLFASHVAAGLEHLASIGVVHGDVACRNLFLTADKVVKIADFGLDSISEEERGLVYMKSEYGRLPIRWMAIESIREGEFSTSSDVWSFGVTLWEIASLGGFPYHDTANSDILATLSAGQRLHCPTNCSEEIYGIMIKCCAAFPGDRPSFSTLHHVFKSLHSTANDGQYITLNVDPNSPYYLISPRSSIVEPNSVTITDDCTPLVTPDPSDVTVVEINVIKNRPKLGPSTSGVSTKQSPEVSHFHSTSFSYSEGGALPCITEEGEDVDNDDEEEREGRVAEGDRKRDSSNDSTYSHDSGKYGKHSDKDDSEESLIVAGATAVEYI